MNSKKQKTEPAKNLALPHNELGYFAALMSDKEYNKTHENHSSKISPTPIPSTRNTINEPQSNIPWKEDLSKNLLQHFWLTHVSPSKNYAQITKCRYTS